jgi:orotidine-5'-phosphate decarboxylase
MKELCALGKVFLDCKFHDIPSTTNSAVRTAFELGATYVTVHASVGSTALGILAQTEKVLSAQREFKILCVTVLTSFDEGTLPKNWKAQSIESHVQNLVTEVQTAGLSGVVCSPHELMGLQNKNLFLVAPGIRFADGDNADQVRVMEPAQALRAGASAIVVARPIIQSTDPVAAAERIVKDMENAL